MGSKLAIQSASKGVGEFATDKYKGQSDNEDISGSEDELEASAYLSQLVGTKCRAPFTHDYGGLHYGNAMIWSVDPPSELDADGDYKVIVFLKVYFISVFYYFYVCLL